jgi:hypothetical protein
MQKKAIRATHPRAPILVNCIIVRSCGEREQRAKETYRAQNKPEESNWPGSPGAGMNIQRPPSGEINLTDRLDHRGLACRPKDSSTKNPVLLPKTLLLAR